MRQEAYSAGITACETTAKDTPDAGRETGGAIEIVVAMTTITAPPPRSVEDTPRRGPLMRFAHALYRYPRRGLIAIFLFIVAAGAIGAPGVGNLAAEGGFTPTDADSLRAIERIEDSTGVQAGPGIVLLVNSPADGAGALVDQTTTSLAGVPGMAHATPAASAPDGTSTMVLGTLRADADEAAVVADVVALFEDSDHVLVGGGAVAGVQMGDQIGADLARAELIAFPILALLAILFFGGRGAVLPVVVGITTVLGTFLALTGINEVYGLSVFALNLVIGLGLGLAVDYTLFLITRYREELDSQGPTFGAVVTTMSTAGRTVGFSAATVAVALATLTVFPLGFLRSMGLSGLIVTLVAASAALIVTPMILGLWGAKLARKRRAATSAGRWYQRAHRVMRRPGAFALATTAIMVLLAVPALRTEWTPVDASVIPPSQSARTVSDAIETHYPATGTTPVTVVMSGDGPTTQDTSAFLTALDSVPHVQDMSELTDLGSETWRLDIEVAGDPTGEHAVTVVEQVRSHATSTGVDALVAGPAAEFLDQQEAIGSNLVLVIALLMALTMIVLWLLTGSVLLPIKAVLMNILTVGVALGALTWVYQDGRFSDVLGYTPNGGIEPTNFLVAAALVFALSTDYGVFLLGRIKEARDGGTTEREAVAVGLGRTGAVVTAAAILLAVAIGAFSVSEISFIQQIGIAVAVGVLIDAFIVRSLLVPSLMALLGKWNWWSPMWLRQVHDRIGWSEGESAATAPLPLPAAATAKD